MKSLHSSFACLFLILGLVLISPHSKAQKVFDKISKDLCKCMEKEEVKSFDKFYPCMEKSTLKHNEKLKSYYQVNTFADIDVEDMSERIQGLLSRDCEVAKRLLADSWQVLESPPRDENIACSDLKTGDFFYVVQNEIGTNDTTFVTFFEHEYLEKMKEGTTYSRCAVEWTSDCSYKLIFIESNDPFKANMSKPGDEYEYEIIQNERNFMLILTQWQGHEMWYRYYKVNEETTGLRY